MQVHAHGRRRQARALGDLRPGQSFHEPQDQRLAIRVGQRADRRQRDVGVGLAGRACPGDSRLSGSSTKSAVRRWKSVARLRAIIAIHPPNAAGSRRSSSRRHAVRNTSCTRSSTSSRADPGEQQAVDDAPVSLVQAGKGGSDPRRAPNGRACRPRPHGPPETASPRPCRRSQERHRHAPRSIPLDGGRRPFWGVNRMCTMTLRFRSIAITEDSE